MAVTLIPRFIWSDKPSFNESNQFYQVAYGVTREADLANVSVAAGVLAEAFMNFGWFGIIVIMFLMGVLYEVYQHVFLSAASGHFASAIGLALILQIVTIESQLSQYLGGIVQQLALTSIAMLPVLRLARPRFRQLVGPLPAAVRLRS